MANPLTKLVAAIVLTAGTSSLATVASAAPLANGPAIKNAVPASVETVQWRRGWGSRGGWGWGGVGAGFVAVYGAPGPAYAVPVAPVAEDAVAYCMQRFKSYDPRSGTYLGYDGARHPCP